MPKRSKNDKVGKLVKDRFNKKNSNNKSKSGNCLNPDRRVKEGSEGFFRSKAKIKMLNMYTKKPNYDKMKERPVGPAKIDPNRKYFGNVRTLDSRQIEKMRADLALQKANPYNVLIKKKILPLSLISDNPKENKVNLLEVESFESTFGPKSRRKKPKLNSYTYTNMLENIDKATDEYKHEKDKDLHKNDILDERNNVLDKMLHAGQSRRIWDELYKVIDSSDVLVQILDARDPLGTRCYHVEEHLKKNCPNKHIVLILNKCDLIPTWVANKWVKHLSKEFPTLAYKASITNAFGMGSFLQLLRQFDNFHKDKKNISIGFIGYPNVGKSSVINSLKRRKACKAAPIPGETKVWQYVTLTKRIYLIDCPGVVYGQENDTPLDTVLKGIVRAERLEDPASYIYGILNKVKKTDLQKIYGIGEWEDDEEFLTLIAKKSGKLLKGGEPDLQTIAKMVLLDWQKGEIPFFNLPPKVNGEVEEENIKEADAIAMLEKANDETVKKNEEIAQEKVPENLGKRACPFDGEDVDEEDDEVIQEEGKNEA
jgi:nuclear GTP-binding protein